MLEHLLTWAPLLALYMVGVGILYRMGSPCTKHEASAILVAALWPLIIAGVVGTAPVWIPVAIVRAISHNAARKGVG
jgi:hypothetical protein